MNVRTVAQEWTAVDMLERFGAVTPRGHVQRPGKIVIGCFLELSVRDEVAGLLRPAGAIFMMKHVVRAFDRDHSSAPVGAPDVPASNAEAFAERVLEVARRSTETGFGDLCAAAHEKLTSDSPLAMVDNLLRGTHASDMPATERLVLRTLAGYAPRPGAADAMDPSPDRETLAGECGISVKTLDDTIAALADRGWLYKVGVAIDPSGRRVFWKMNGQVFVPLKPGWKTTSNAYALNPERGRFWPADSRAGLARKAPPGKAQDRA